MLLKNVIVFNKVISSIDDLNKKNAQMDKAFQDLSIKATSFDIKELLLNNTNDGRVDTNQLMIDMLEKKFNKKFDIHDQNFKNNDTNIMKIRNEIQNMKNEVNNRPVEHDIPRDIILDHSGEVYDKLKQEYENADNALYEKMIDLIDLKLAEVKDSYRVDTDPKGKSMEEVKEEVKPKSNRDDEKVLKDFNKRINELEKNFKLFSSSLNADVIKSEFVRLNDALENKASIPQISDLRETQSIYY